MYADNFLCLQINTDESSDYKVKIAHWHSGIFVSAEPHASACLIMGFLLLLLYAEAAWLSTAKTALHKLRAPRGICGELNLKPLLFLLLCFANGRGGGGGGGGGGGADKMLQRLQGSAWLSSGVQQNPFFRIRAVLLLSNYCISPSMHCLDSTVRSLRRQSEPGLRRLMCHFVTDLGDHG